MNKRKRVAGVWGQNKKVAGTWGQGDTHGKIRGVWGYHKRKGPRRLKA